MKPSTAAIIGSAIGSLLAGFAIGVYVNQYTPTGHFGNTNDEKLCLFLRTEMGSTRKAKLLIQYAKRYDIDPLFFAAACYRESSFDPKAYSTRPKGAMGEGERDRGWFGMWDKRCVEIAEKVWKDKQLAQEIRDRPALLYEPDLNADFAGQNLRLLLDSHGSVHDMFDAYAFHNSGPSGKGNLENARAVKDKYFEYAEKYEKFDWRKAR